MDASPTDRNRGASGTVLVALLLVYVVWGSTYFGLRVALESIPPMLLSGTRFLLAGVVLYAIVRARGAPAPTRVQFLAAARVGVLLLVIGNGAVAIAEQWVSSSVAAVAVATMPLWAGLFAMMWGERPAAAEWVGLGVGLVGVALLHAGGELMVSFKGALALVLGPVGWALGSVWSRRLPMPPGPMATALEMIVAGIVMIVIGLLIGERLTTIPTARSIAAWSYLVVFGSLIAFTAFMYLLQHARPALATSYAYVNPVIAVILGWAMGGERIKPLTWVALAVILAGVAAITRARTRSSFPTKPEPSTSHQPELTPPPESRPRPATSES